MKTTADLIIKFRWLIIIAFIAVSIIFALQIPKTEIEPGLKNQLPHDMPSRIITDQIDTLFGGTEMIMVMLNTDDVLNTETLKRIKILTKKFKRLKGIDRVFSPFELKNIKGEDGSMIVDPAVKKIPKTDEQREVLRQEIIGNDLVYGNVISKDFTAAAVIGVIESGVLDDYIIAETNRIIEETPGDEEIVIAGLPYIRCNIHKDIKSDTSRLMPFGLLLMLAFLFISFRQLRGVLLPFIVVAMSILFAMGLISLLGWKIQTVTVILPIMLLAIANDYGIHLIARYQEDNIAGSNISKAELAKGIFQSLTKPIILTGLTTIAGMLCLLNHVIIPAAQLGILSAAGILFALTASLLFIPAVLSIIPKAKPILNKPGDNKTPLLERMLIAAGNLVSGKPKVLIVSMLLFTMISAIGIFYVEVDTNPSNYYSEGSPVVYANDLANEKFGGSTSISVVIKGDIKQPEIMNKIDRIENKLKEMPEVGNTTSIARVIRQMSRALNDENEEGYDRIPDTRNAVAQYFELYSMSGDPDDFDKLVDFPYEHAQITARIKEISTKKIDNVVNHVRDMTKDDKNVEMVGGFATVLAEFAQLVVRGQLISLVMAIVIVAIFLMIMFRSFTAGIISVIPLLITLAILFGLMGFLGIELNIVTALLSSIMIGVGIDYTIHFLWRYKEERNNNLKPKDAVKVTLTTTGRGIIFNALSVIIGFTALLISNFLPVQFFGFLVVVSISSCLIGALILIPAICIIFRPKFLEPKANVLNTNSILEKAAIN